MCFHRDSDHGGPESLVPDLMENSTLLRVQVVRGRRRRAVRRRRAAGDVRLARRLHCVLPRRHGPTQRRLQDELEAQGLLKAKHRARTTWTRTRSLIKRTNANIRFVLGAGSRKCSVVDGEHAALLQVVPGW